MKKSLVILLLALVMIISACGNKEEKDTKASANNDSPKMVTYKSETGDMQVPANPKRVVALTNGGNFIALGIPLVGVEEWTTKSPLYDKELKGVEIVSEDDIEKISALEPDLIVAPSTSKTLNKLKKIAPTVSVTYNKLDYMEQHIEFGRLVGKEAEAQKWVDDYKTNSAALGKEIKAKIGEDATVTVLEAYGKEMSVFGDAWGRGTEVLYQALGLKMQDKVKKATAKDGYFSLSQEVIGDYIGDYVVISKYADQNNTFQNTKSYKNIPAVKKGHVIEANGYAFMFNDPIAVDHQLEVFKENFLN
ncbi:iron-hydroxamate ABC transporter substrate-binding protein [Kurthia sibirica]|uniref:ABC transporter substrate-binding protein n=1 Tax=Kurthia sibirica TaxID=202750 RepID=A0A2U3ANI8_9BACL|nr:iron-hydroxamate ABC transporter substrate-binding protein [Kurthia sibirica]PWI26110.1 ABC transporter substrate-binding protein [Kurthia sibirica]GEK34948.1 ABC transporter substrate-binding protein [Kurthia sibirica]